MYETEENAGHCKNENNYLHGVKCCSCNKPFVSRYSNNQLSNANQVKPSGKYPVRVCMSYHGFAKKDWWCKSAWCFNCWGEALSSGKLN